MTGGNRFEMESVGSTQVHLNELLIKQDLPEGSLVFTFDQTRGRGMQGNQWESSRGLNLTFSFVWYPYFLRTDHQFQMNKAIALAVHDFVTTNVKEQKVSIKWPNDIYIDAQKVSGMLIENSIMDRWFHHSITGIGMNINQEKFSAALSNATSLKIATGQTFDLYHCLDEMCRMLDKRYEQLKTDIRIIDADYKKNLYLFGISAPYRYKGSDIRASITGISQYGQLNLELENGESVSCDMKEIKFLQEV
jgi:BirA family transcriptional regulator, biotin operon repressor / biotin---[acetyl-CoA-carboxylase] ligase